MSTEQDQENVPLLSEGSQQDSNVSYYTEDNQDSEYITEYGDGSQAAQRAHRPTGATVTCRVCDASVQLEGRNTQHVVKCHICDEATPIRPAPPGKKYVRCPCNCLLICKASSTRIACPRNNCRRVITLDTAGHRDPASAIRAPTGSCRVSCVHCNEIFLFNTLTNSLATCPHCKQHSAVGPFARRRSIIFFFLCAVLTILTVIFILMTRQRGYSNLFIFPSWFFCFFCVGFAGYKSFNYWMIRVSHVLSTIDGF